LKSLAPEFNGVISRTTGKNIIRIECNRKNPRATGREANDAKIRKKIEEGSNKSIKKKTIIFIDFIFK